MSYSSEQTKMRILQCAKAEFLKKGFLNANLRDIAKEAKTTTGALYNHFKSKDALLNELVEGPAQELLRQMEAMGGKICADESLSNGSFAEEDESCDWVLDYIYDNFDCFKLIFCCSEGSSYANYVEKLTAIEESGYYAILRSEEGFTQEDEFFVHVICAMGYQELIEVIAHDLTREQAHRFMDKLKKFRFAGWRALM